MSIQIGNKNISDIYVKVGSQLKAIDDVCILKDGKLTTVYSSKIKYRYPIYNTASDPTSGIKEWKTGQLNDGEYTLVKSSSSQVTWNEGWHVVKGEVTIDGGAVCNGAVKLLLTDGCKLKIQNVAENNAGIQVTEDSNSFTIYGQVANTGILSVNNDEPQHYGAGIGGGYEQVGKNITINGGVVEILADEAAIGGGAYYAGSNITINGGTVTATSARVGAGIGGGSHDVGENITINGGTVVASGGKDAAGIGGGYYNGNGQNIIINGGIVTATGAYNASSIGGGSHGAGSNIKVSASLTVSAGTTTQQTVIEHYEGEDIANKLAGMQYATVR